MKPRDASDRAARLRRPVVHRPAKRRAPASHPIEAELGGLRLKRLHRRGIIRDAMLVFETA
jgi:hypothetical protein